MFFKQFVALVLCVLPVLAAPSPLVTVKKTKGAVPGSYIVIFNHDIAHDTGVSSITRKISSQSKVTHEWSLINGFAGTFTDADLEILRANLTSSPLMRMVTPTPRPPPLSKPLSKPLLFSDRSVILMRPLRTDAPWGLGRISSKT